MSEVLASTETEIVPAENHQLTTHQGENLEDYVTFYIGDQMFGIPVLRVQDILTPNRIAPIPLAPKEVKGSINLRGRIVTVVDVRIRLGLPEREGGDTNSMGVTVEQDHDLYTLLVDRIGDSGRQVRRRHRSVQEIIRKESRHPGFQVARIFKRRLSAGEKPDGGP